MSSYSARRAERPLKIRRALSEDFSKLPSCSEDDVENVVEQSRISHFNAFDTGERYQLPVMGTGKSDSFQRISSETLANLINGCYDGSYDQYYIIDCRFPYEFEGGHIKHAINIDTKESAEKLIFEEISQQKGKTILIFHCEYSSVRGPKMAQFTRTWDRKVNCYPNLHFPEIYILEGGYKQFYPEFKELCVPQEYIPMDHPDFKEEYLEAMKVFKKTQSRRSKKNHRLDL